MTGMCRHTGRRLDGWDHIKQSLEVLFTTRLGTRLERRPFGSAVPELQDRPTTPETVADYFVAVAEAIDQYEPRVELRGFQLIEGDENGQAVVVAEVFDRNTQSLRTIEVVK